MPTASDRASFAAYAANVDMLIRAKRDIELNGMTVEGSRGPIRNPAVAVFTAATAAMKSLAGEFGLTPSSRSRITVPTATTSG